MTIIVQALAASRKRVNPRNSPGIHRTRTHHLDEEQRRGNRMIPEL